METIPSFNVNHFSLEPGIYVSRIDKALNGGTITTFDIRMTRPNREPAIDPKALHTMEHIVATYLRNAPIWKNIVIYWGPMGCCTGNYLILNGDFCPNDIQAIIKSAMKFVADFEGPIPGAHPRACGNYSFMDLEGAKAAARKFLNENWQFEYPQ